MILNNADNIMYGSQQVDRIYYGAVEVWSRGESSLLELDTSRFDASDPRLYSTSGKVIGSVNWLYSGSPQKTYVGTDGLHTSSGADCAIPIDLPADKPWTIEYTIRNWQQGSSISWVFGSSGSASALETAYVRSFSNDWIHCRLGSDSAHTTLYNNCARGDGNGFKDTAAYAKEMCRFRMVYQWVNDGTSLSLYVNGVRKASVPSSELSVLHFPNKNNTAYSEDKELDIASFRVLKYADAPTHKLYRMRVTGYRGSDGYVSIAKMPLYAGNTRIDQDERNFVYSYMDNAVPTRPDSRSFPLAMLNLPLPDSSTVYNNGVYQRGTNWDIVFAVHRDLPDVTSYSYITPTENFPNRDPVSWILYKSVDGGITWTEIDSRSNVADPGRDAETERFYINS